MLICFEGIDGAGKKTQSDMLIDELGRMGRASSKYSYPDYGSRYGKIIREWLDKRIDLNVNEQFLIYLLDFVKDAGMMAADLEAGKVIVMDRFFFSTVAYQCANGFDYGLSKRIIELLNLQEPDVLVYLDISGEVALDRKIKEKGSADRLEEKKNFQDRVNGMYKKQMGDGFGAKKWEIIDGTQSIDRVHGEVMKRLTALIGENNK